MTTEARSSAAFRAHQVVLLLLAWTALARAVRAQAVAIQIDSNAPVNLLATEVAAMRHEEISVDDHGKVVRFEGVPLRLVLEKGGVTFGESLRGKRLSSCLLAEASDGYKVVIALPELDPGFTDRIILLADRADGHPLDTKEGPFRIIVPGEKRRARWMRQVTTLKIVQVQ
jgi:hypothetical protein